MSVVTIHEDSKLPLEELQTLASSAGLSLDPNHVDDWRTLLGSMDDKITSILDAEDFTLTPDLSFYSRTDISIPKGPVETDMGGWATCCVAKATNPKSELLKDKTIALKDNIALAGVRCTNGTDAVPWTPSIDATVATRIMDASGTILGKAACESACMEGCSDSSCTGPVHNPYADGYSCGGSSSGSGRLVATGQVDLAMGGDQGGSIRIPASMCGIVGLKPTWGLVPYSGILSLEATIDHAGPMARSCKDAALLLEAIAGPDGIDDRQPPFLPPGTLNFSAQLASIPTNSNSKPLSGLKIGLLSESFSLSCMSPAIAALVRRAADQFISLGASLHEISIPQHTTAASLWSSSLYISGGRTALLNAPESRKQLHLLDRPVSSHLPQETFSKLGAGAQQLYLGHLYMQSKFLEKGIHGKCTNLLHKLDKAYTLALTQVDVLLTPTLPCLPSKLTSSPSSMGPLERLTRNLGLVSNTAPFDSTGHPAVSIPCGFLENEEGVKLPVGLQLVGRKWEDAAVLKVGAAWEGSVDWKTF